MTAWYADIKWRVQLWLAHRGWWFYHGIEGMAPKGWPHARVRYPDGNVSRCMPIGNAANLQAVFGGKVERP